MNPSKLYDMIINAITEAKPGIAGEMLVRLAGLVAPQLTKLLTETEVNARAKVGRLVLIQLRKSGIV